MSKALAQDQLSTTETQLPNEDNHEAVAVTVVVPLFNEMESVPELVRRITEALEDLKRPYEILLVDDGSTDGTGSIIADLSAKWPFVRTICLARNYGQSTAMQAGFDAARGDLIVTIDGDLQNDPADIPDMVSLLEKEDVDLVCGWRENRKDPPVRKLFSRIANRLISSLTGVKLHDFGCSLKVYKRSILERTRLYGEMHRFLPALLTEVGAQICEIAVRHHARKFGRSKYGLDRTLRVVLDLLLVLFFRKYLQRPLHVFGGIGVFCFLPGSLILVYLAVIKLGFNQAIGARPLLTLGALLTLIGLMFIGQGLLGELIIRILHGTGARAQYHLTNKTTQHPHQNKSSAEGRSYDFTKLDKK